MSQHSPQQISAHLQESKSLHPTPAWLASFLASQRPNTPLAALVQTASFRLLASDITRTLVGCGEAEGGREEGESSCFPADVGDVRVGERRLGGGGGGGAIMTQVLAVEDLSKSRWEQIEAIEALERGEGTKGREIIRVTTATTNAGGGEQGDEQEEEEDALAATGSRAGVQRGGGPHKLLLQDASGRRIWAMELRRVDGVGLGMCIGCKILLKGARIARGWVLLEPETTSMVGGKIEDLQRKWREGRKAELKAQLDVAVDRRTL